MYVENGHVVIDKGYMEYKTFINHYRKLLKKFNNFKNKSLVIHCRIGTSGKNNKGNTHPYPITDKPKLLHTKKLIQDIGIAHNGIIKGYGTPEGLNDTQEFIIKYIYPLYSNYKEFYKNEEIMKGIETITNSKLAILDSEENIYYVGDFIEDKDLKFSNNTYNGYSYYTSYNYNYDYGTYTAKESKVKDTYDSYNDYLDDKYNESYNEDYMIRLESNWYVDLYSNGHSEVVGDRNLWYDYESLYLYETKGTGTYIVAMNPIIYDEKFREIS